MLLREASNALLPFTDSRRIRPILDGPRASRRLSGLSSSGGPRAFNFAPSFSSYFVPFLISPFVLTVRPVPLARDRVNEPTGRQLARPGYSPRDAAEVAAGRPWPKIFTGLVRKGTRDNELNFSLRALEVHPFLYHISQCLLPFER